MGDARRRSPSAPPHVALSHKRCLLTAPSPLSLFRQAPRSRTCAALRSEVVRGSKSSWLRATSAVSCPPASARRTQSWHEGVTSQAQLGGHDLWMPASAPRYDPRLVRAIRRLDDEALPIAEVWRRVGGVAERLGVPRPSYVHLRRIVVSERERTAELREIRDEALVGLVSRTAPDPVDLALRRSEVLAGDRRRPGRSRR